MKVRNDGMVSIVHNPSVNPNVAAVLAPYVDVNNETSITYFSVPWGKDPITSQEVFPQVDNNCGNRACQAFDDDHCLCTVQVTESPAFDKLPTRIEILSTLHIGAFDLAIYTDNPYSLLESAAGVDAYTISSANTIGATTTIFKVTDDFGDVIYLKNMLSSIKLGGIYALRNPVGFIDLVKMETRDAEYEVESFIKHLLQYKSAPPFISKKLIQYFGISNPSPDYIQRVMQAFRTGTFTHSGTTFGDGKYGNLAAVAAAIFLDSDSRLPVVDEDPVSGNVREPLLKLIQVMRSLEFRRHKNIKFRHGIFADITVALGQMVFDPPGKYFLCGDETIFWTALGSLTPNIMIALSSLPDQFSFFSSENTPPGIFSEVELVSPEAQVFSMGSVVGFTTGLFSLINNGLAYAERGFARYLGASPYNSVGALTYQVNGVDVASKIDDLSTMITSGRLSEENKQVLTEAYNYFAVNFDADSADRALLQLILTSPEFHTSNTCK